MKRTALLLLIALFALVACSPAAEDTPAPASEGTDITAVPTTEDAPPTTDETAESMADEEDTSTADDSMTDETDMADDSMTDETDMADDSMTDETDMADDSMTDDTDMADDSMTEDTDMADDSMTEDTESAAIAYNGPDWTTVEMVNARTGETFMLADFAGKTVFVEPMATWCSNCLAQQRQVREAVPQLDGEQFVFISLSVEAGLPDDQLSTYAENNNFDWLFVVGSQELVSALTDHFGRLITSPPSTPHFTIAPDGTVSDLSTGRHSASDLVAKMTAVNGG